MTCCHIEFEKEIEMLICNKNGKRIECHPILANYYEDQMVICDQITYPLNPDPKEYSLAKYPTPYIFTIVKDENGKTYLRDFNGRHIPLEDKNSRNLYDVYDWLVWSTEHHKEESDRVTLLEGDHADLKQATEEIISEIENSLLSKHSKETVIFLTHLLAKAKKTIAKISVG